MTKKIPHIQVDAFPLVDNHFSGVGHSTLGIVRGLDELAGEGKLTYSLITPRKWTNRIAKYNFEHVKSVIANPVPNRIIRGFMKYHLRVPFDVILGRGSYYFPSFLAWPLWFSRASVVVHDVTYLAVPDCVDSGNRDYLERVVPFSLKNATNVISVSEFSKKEIIKYYDLEKSDVHVALNSIDRQHFYRRSEKEIHKVRARYDIFSEKYILSVGNIEPRKNYIALIEAYMGLPKKITDTYPLVIVGAGGWNNTDIETKMQEAKELGYKIINPKQFVLDADMPALFSGAELFVFIPSYEGFGMPPLEAIACMTPTIVSDIPPLHEAVGKAAVYVNYDNVAEVRDKIESTLAMVSEKPHYFDKAIKHHLDLLTWRRSAEITAVALTGLPIEYFQKKGE